MPDAVPSAPIRVLLVEDVGTDVELEIRELKRAGISLQHLAVDTEPAFRKGLAEFDPDVILSDFSMPEFDGMRALVLARELRPEIPFIFVSGTIGEEYAIRALKNGAVDYVLKTNLVRLPAAVERALQDARELAVRREMERALQLSEERYRTAFEQVAVGILHTSLEGGVQAANPKICAMAGYSHAETIGLDVQGLVHPDDRAESAEARAKLIAGTAVPNERELRLLRKDGSHTWVNVTTSLVWAADGEPLHFISVLHDISERKAQQERIARLTRVYAVLSGINALIVRVRDRDELFKGACKIAVDAGKFLLAWIGVVNRAENAIELTVWEGDAKGYVQRMPIRLKSENVPNAGLNAQAVAENRPQVANDIENDPRFLLQEQALARGFRSFVTLPLSTEGEVTAVLALYAEQVGFFDDEEMKLLTELAGDISFALDHIAKEERLTYIALYDPVTGLANRTLFLDRVAQCIHAAGVTDTKVALVLADVERFTAINESLGRQEGDGLLKQLAGRLVLDTRQGDVARIGADNFAILLQDVKGKSEVTRRVDRMWHGCFSEPFRLNETDVRISAKAGIALFQHAGDATAEMLLNHAEAALRRAKESGERHAFYAQAMTANTGEKLTLENQLRQALEKDEFVLHYQPKVDLTTRRIVGVEALIRWQSPELGLVPPMKFIPLMEETGLILPVGAWALKRASLDHRRWADQGLKAPRVAVNVSPIQLRQRDFVRSVEQAIAGGVTPTGIDLEITESLIMEDIEGNIEKLKAIRNLGMTIAIDDFGTGYSSLGYLAKLPVQTLKIDRSFIITMLNDGGAMTLVQTIISLAHSLKLKVVAEGVDQEEQAKVLRLLRCEEMQGYLVSRPIPFDQMTALLAQGTPG